MALIVIRFGIFVHLHIRRPQLDIRRNTVSGYGADATRREFSVMAAITMSAYAVVIIVGAILGVEAASSFSAARRSAPESEEDGG
ncbi:MAG: hypothetical protein QM607_04475 [Microbacterium sp.]